MKPPIKNLIGGVKELHTGSICSKSQLEWCAVERDRKSPPRTARTQELEQNSCFWRERKEEEEDIPGGGALGPRRSVGTARGQAAPAGRLGHWWPPLVSPGASGSLPAWKFFI